MLPAVLITTLTLSVKQQLQVSPAPSIFDCLYSHAHAQSTPQLAMKRLFNSCENDCEIPGWSHRGPMLGLEDESVHEGVRESPELTQLEFRDSFPTLLIGCYGDNFHSPVTYCAIY